MYEIGGEKKDVNPYLCTLIRLKYQNQNWSRLTLIEGTSILVIGAPL